jgi:hypothetical protein
MKTFEQTLATASPEESTSTSATSGGFLEDLDDVVSAAERPYYQTWDEYEAYVTEAIAGPSAASSAKR